MRGHKTASTASMVDSVVSMEASIASFTWKLPLLLTWELPLLTWKLPLLLTWELPLLTWKLPLLLTRYTETSFASMET